jgi:hypothetical protein
MKDRILYGLIIILILLLLGSVWYSRHQQRELYQKIQEGNKMIIDADKTTKEGDGQYAKLVDYFNTEKELNQQLKNQNKELFDLIKKQDEKLLMINNTVISMKQEIAEGFGNINEEDTNLIDIKLTYPNEGDTFITWDGYVNRNNAFYSGNWEFGKLPLQVIMTETDRGLWKSRLVGPEWLLVDSIEVNSLPLPTIEKKSNFGLFLGGGYVNSFDPNGVNAVSIGGGIKFKDHRLLINATTNKEIGFSYYYDILNFKKKK